MLIGMRNAMLEGGGLSAKSYVQDGLVAMWDVIENAGWGKHSDERILTNLVTGETTAIPDSGYTIGENCIYSQPRKTFILGNLAGKISTPCTITSVGCCTYLPTNRDNLSGLTSVSGIGSVGMWRINGIGASGVVIGSIYQTDGKIHYFGAPGQNNIAMSEAQAERFGVMRSRAAVIVSRQTSSGLVYYYNGIAKNGINTVSYTDGWSSPTYDVRSPSALSTEIKWGNIAVYSRALTADEIAANYAVDKARFNLP